MSSGGRKAEWDCAARGARAWNRIAAWLRHWGVSDVFDAPARRPIPGKASGVRVFKGIRTPVALVVENLEHGMTRR